jgi:hypothetical protein
MELRHALSAVGMTLSSFLTAGCILFPNDTSRAEQVRMLNELEVAEQANAAVVSEPPIVPPPPPPSDYQSRPAPQPAGLTASVEPDGKRVQFTVAPAVRSKAPAEESPSMPPVPVQPESPLVAALRCALQKHPQEAQRLLDKYDKTDRDLLMALMKLTAGIGEKEILKLGAGEMASTLEQLGALTAHLRQRAGLTLDRVCFCRKIEGFGQFEALPSSHPFQPGSEGRPGDRVHVYAELSNFSSRLNDGQYETTLSSTLKFVDMQNREVDTLDLGSCVDRCQSRRQDYFLNVQFHVPPKLPAGVYTLHVVVEDQTPGVTRDKANHIATRSLSFRVGAAGVVAAKP